MKKSVIALSLVLILLVTGLFFYLRDMKGPVLTVSPGEGPVSAQRTLLIDLADKGSGLKTLSVFVTQEGEEQELFTRSYGSGTIAAGEEFTLEKAGLKDGPIAIRIVATDRSIYPLGSGNTTEQTLSYAFDSRAPMVSIVSQAHNFNQGGAGLVLYTLSEEPARTGVKVGDFFFPGFPLQGETYASFMAFPWSMKMSEFKPRLLAEDEAGNVREVGFYYHANARNFPRDRINVGESFLQSKMPEFEPFFPGVSDPLELFLKVNRDLRRQNVDKLQEIGLNTASEKLWEGSFLRQPNAATRGHFAQGRTYFHKGNEIDRQTHLGLDLASLAQAPVLAANRGKVVFADYLGIYGNCVVLDHGMGLQTVYAHLSQIDVEEGDLLEKGQTLGRSGATGMAGGDHLHFEVTVSGVSVVPLEWWDDNWMENNIMGKLERVKQNEIL